MKNSILFLKSRIFFKQILWAVAVLVLLVIGSMQWLSWSTKHGEQITVPDLTKIELQEVEELLASQHLRFQVIDSANFNPDYPANSVISQQPKAGSLVKANKKIYLQLNPSGYSDISLPALIQLTQRNAASKLQAVGLKIGKVTYIDALGKDMVYGIKYKNMLVKEGFNLPKMSEVELICGNGVRPKDGTPNPYKDLP
ncbi:PASTA domain-containing protein [Flavobacteriaceae bacterium LSUCC0859]|nr:PASTA domain-containing protein [Flavobacteriaceae bacterium LSUCC0859]